MLPPFWAGEAGFDEILEIHALLFCRECWIVCSRGNLGIFGFHLLELCRADKAKALIRPCHRGPQPPSDLFHVFLACQSPVFVERALADRKMNFTLDVEGSAIDLYFRSTKSGNDVAARARPAQGFASFRSAPYYSNRDHSFLFSKKRFSASGCALAARTYRARTPGARQCGTKWPRYAEIILKMCRKRIGLTEERGRRPPAAAIISLRQRRKTAYMFHPLHGTQSSLGQLRTCHRKCARENRKK